MEGSSAGAISVRSAHRKFVRDVPDRATSAMRPTRADRPMTAVGPRCADHARRLRSTRRRALHRPRFPPVAVAALDGAAEIPRCRRLMRGTARNCAMSRKPMPHRLESPSGLTIEVNANGSIRRIDHGDVVVNLFLGSEIEGGPANVWLRRRGAAITSTPLLGPREPGHDRVRRRRARRCAVSGRASASRSMLVLAAAAPAWFWHLRLENVGTRRATVDVVYAQDLALAPLRRDPDERVLREPVRRLHAARCIPSAASCSAVRQNLAMGGRHPWALVGALGRGVGFATDALAAARPRDPRRRHAGRARCAGAPGHAPAARARDGGRSRTPPSRSRRAPVATRGFFGWFEADHPEVTSEADLAAVARVAGASGGGGARAGAAAPPAASAAARDALQHARRSSPATTSTPPRSRSHFGDERRHVETRDGTLLSFFTGAHQHVVLQAKERRDAPPARPHPADRRRARAGRGVAHVDRVDGRRLPLARDPGPRRASTACSRRRAPISGCFARTGCASSSSWTTAGSCSACRRRSR